MAKVFRLIAGTRKEQQRDKVPDPIAPTPEQMGQGHYELSDITDKQGSGVAIRIGKAYRRRPMIDVLLDADVLTREQHKALRHYRHHADIADRSLMRDSLCIQRGGHGNGPTITTLNAVAVTRDCEAAAGSLVDILRAVVVYDMSLSKWAMERAGGLEECYIRKGKTVCQIKPRRHALKVARQEIRMAAVRVQAELDA